MAASCTSNPAARSAAAMPAPRPASSVWVASQHRYVTLTSAFPPVALNVPPLSCTGRLSSLFL